VKQAVQINNLKEIKIIVAKTKFFVVLEEELLFISDGATVAYKDQKVAEPVESLVTV